MTDNSNSKSDNKVPPNSAKQQSSAGLSPDQQKEIGELVTKTLDLDLQQALENHGPENRFRIIRQWHLWQAPHKEKIRESGWDFFSAIQKAFYDHDVPTKHNSFLAAKELGCFEIMADLVRVIVQPNYLHKDKAGDTLEFLARVWYRLCVQNDEPIDPEVDAVVSSLKNQNNSGNLWPANQAHLRRLLEEAAGRFSVHKRKEILIAFFLVLDFTDVILKKTLQTESHPAHLVTIQFLETTTDPIVLDKLAGFIGTRNPSNAMVDVWRKRDDDSFISSFFGQVEKAVPNVVGSNLRRLGQPKWLENSIKDFGFLSIEHQSAVLIIAQVTITNQDQLLEFLLKMLTAAHLPVQRQLVAVLCSIPGAKSTQVIEYLLETQNDAAILTVLIPQIRRRNLHGAMKKLLAFLDHPSPEVQQAAGESFGDCTVKRYLQAFDMLTEKVRVSTGQLVSKVDPTVCRVLLEDLTCPHKTIVLKALVALRYISRRDELESAVCDLARNHDPKVREAAVETLGYIPSENVKQVLRRSLADQDARVQRAAERSLQFLTGL